MRWGDYSGLSGMNQCNYKSSYKFLQVEDGDKGIRIRDVMTERELEWCDMRTQPTIAGFEHGSQTGVQTHWLEKARASRMNAILMKPLF